jgi:hypothetical protein
MIFVAHVRHHGENIHSQILGVGIMRKIRKNGGRQGILVSYLWKVGMGVATLYFGH